MLYPRWICADGGTNYTLKQQVVNMDKTITAPPPAPVWSHQPDSHLCTSKCSTKPSDNTRLGMKRKSLMLIMLSGRRQPQSWMKVDIIGFKSDIGVPQPQLAAAASRVYERNKRETPEKLSETANTFEHSWWGEEEKRENGPLA